MSFLLLLVACGENITPATTLDDTDVDTSTPEWLLESEWCQPNPCAEADRGTCRVADDVVVCLCDEGFSEAGDGTCVEDVCLPNPCDVLGGTDCAEGVCLCEDDGVRDSWGRCVQDAEECQDPADNPVSSVETGGFAVHLGPAVGTDGAVYVPQLGRGVIAIAPDGSQPWNPRYDYTAASPLALGSDGAILTGDAEGVLHVLHPDDGRDWWTWPTTAAITARPAASSTGPIYVGSTDGTLYAVEAAQELWTRDFRNAVDVRPAIGTADEPYALAVVDDEGSWVSVLYQLDPTNGDIEWKVDPAELTLAVGSPAVMADGTVVVAAGTALVAASPEGDVLWSLSLPAPADSEPVPDGNGGLYLVAGGELCRVESEAVAWCLAGVPALTVPAVAQQLHAAFGGEAGELQLVSPAGERVWSLPLGGSLTAAARGGDGALRLGSTEGVVHTVAFCGACTQTWCDGDQLMGCREDGLGMQALEDCTSQDAVCVDGACRVESYDPEAWRGCTEDGASWFDSEGEQGELIDACEVEEHCVQGTCVGCWSQRGVGCADEATVSVFDECGNPEEVVEVCDTPTDGCVEGRCLECTAHEATVCVDGQPYWADACGRVEDAATPCDSDETCIDGACEACASHAETRCDNGHPWWYDGCGNKEDQADTCGYYDECVEGACVEDCHFLECTAATFTYTCASGVTSRDCTYDGAGPNGLDACTTTYDNGHAVTCTWTAETTGSCVDDGSESCSF